MTEAALLEALASAEHDSWARWMTYFFTKCRTDGRGGLYIVPSYVDALRKQIDMPYAHLSEQEKEYDRDEVRHILPIIHRYAGHDTEEKEVEHDA